MKQYACERRVVREDEGNEHTWLETLQFPRAWMTVALALVEVRATTATRKVAKVARANILLVEDGKGGG